MVFAILKTTPKLAPYFAFIGVGTSMAVTFASWRLTAGPDVVVNKLRADPWNDVSQGTNTKLYTRRPDWWANRADIPHPQAAFREEKESGITRALAAKRKLRKMDEEKANAAKHVV